MTLEINDLRFSYRKGVQVLKGVSFSAQRGEVLSVLGPNGVGKSTLFKCILGTLSGYEGSITVDGEDLREMPQRKKAGKIAYIPQSNAPAFSYLVKDTVLMGTTRMRPIFQQPGRAQQAAAEEAMEKMGITELAERSFLELSGGEQQLVLIARALAQQADILVMDEPTSSLDYGNQYRVLERICALAKDGYSVLLSTHNPQHALTFADTVLALKGGAVEALGPAGDVLVPELMESLYNVSVRMASVEGESVIVPKRQRRN